MPHMACGVKIAVDQPAVKCSNHHVWHWQPSQRFKVTSVLFVAHAPYCPHSLSVSNFRFCPVKWQVTGPPAVLHTLSKASWDQSSTSAIKSSPHCCCRTLPFMWPVTISLLWRQSDWLWTPLEFQDVLVIFRPTANAINWRLTRWMSQL